MFNRCYSYRFIQHENPRPFDSFVDCCYILTMTNSTRHEQVLAQIRDVPLSKIYIQYNEGYKNCEKTLKQQTPTYDIKHAFAKAFTHALYHGFERVLILEDDAIIDVDRVYCPKTIQSIKKFIEHKNPFVYMLGPIPAIPHPLHIFNDHQLLLFALTFHAVIFNKEFMTMFLDMKLSQINGHIDAAVSKRFRTYGYKRSLIYQTFPNTDNQTHWKDARLLRGCIKLLRLDKHPQPGFDIARFVTTFMWILMLIFLFVIFSCKF